MLRKTLIALVCASTILLISGTAVADEVLYDNGPVSTCCSAYATYAGQTVTDSFTLAGPATVTSATVYIWVQTGDTPEWVNWSVTSTPFASSTLASGSSSFSNELSISNLYGLYDVYASTFSIPSLDLGSGSYWLQINSAGGKDFPYTYWDVNNGPSSAYVWNTSNPIPSEAFTINGASTVPEPGSMVLLGSGVALLARKRKLLKH